MNGLYQRAADATVHFRVCRYGSQEDFMQGRVTVLKHDAPEWPRDAVEQTHGTLDTHREPDEFKFDAARRAVDAIAANPHSEVDEIEESFATDTNTGMADLMDWAESHPARIAYCRRILGPDRTTAWSMNDLLRRAQALELREVFQTMRAALEPGDRVPTTRRAQ